ncbi:hypothetical protein N0V83_010553 [Neocucurbitaria cava]|uniref:Uncharacterized protein n=1 Tax=Neocucurbitaria cava TaxID=798079 RepID=A0A9W9CHI7_9PLEO|nr:hypothetical protein N0V83_010553 [Neocucurbitaria cava]
MTSTKRKAGGELVSPPQKRQRGISRGPPASPPRESRPSSVSPPVSAYEVVEEAGEDYDDLLWRVRSGIKYVLEQQSKGEAIKQATRFEIAITSQSRGGDLLRRYATPIYASTTHEVFELGVPRPEWVTAGILPGLHDPQWWLDKSAAKIKAGPWAEEHDVKRAAANLKGLQTRKKKKKGPTAREKDNEWKLREGIRRQERRLKMHDDTDTEMTEDESEREIEEQFFNGRAERVESEDDMPIKRGVRKSAPKGRARLSTIPEEKSEDDMPIRRGVWSMAPRGRARPPTINDEESDSDSEEDIPLVRDPRYLRRGVCSMAPRGRARPPIIDDEESDSDSEEDIPLVRDPRYLQYKRGLKEME